MKRDLQWDNIVRSISSMNDDEGQVHVPVPEEEIDFNNVQVDLVATPELAITHPCLTLDKYATVLVLKKYLQAFLKEQRRLMLSIVSNDGEKVPLENESVTLMDVRDNYPSEQPLKIACNILK